MIVAFDTSSAVCSVAVVGHAGDGSHQVLAARDVPSQADQTKLLLGLIDQALTEVGATPEQVTAFFVGTGPGTFTGVRIGVATARALSLALDVPVFGRSSLDALAAAALMRGLAPGEGGTVAPDTFVPVVDARRGQVFATVFVRAHGSQEGQGRPPETVVGSHEPTLVDADGLSWVRLGEVFAADPAGVAESVDLVAGPGAGARAVYLGRTDLLPETSARHEPGEVEAGFLVLGHAVALPEPAAFRKARPGDPGTPESVRPIYVRSPDADVHIAKMRDPWA